MFHCLFADIQITYPYLPGLYLDAVDRQEGDQKCEDRICLNHRREEHLLRLRERFSSPEFPHEIGLFLGYPKKDVEGFVRTPGGGRSVPRGLWRVFGSAGESMVKMNCFRFAEKTAEHALRECGNVALCVDKIKGTDLRMLLSF